MSETAVFRMKTYVYIAADKKMTTIREVGGMDDRSGPEWHLQDIPVCLNLIIDSNETSYKV